MLCRRRRVDWIYLWAQGTWTELSYFHLVRLCRGHHGALVCGVYTSPL
jgi:hypothetical protein